MGVLITFIISFIILLILKFPILEVILMSAGIALIYYLRVFLLFIIMSIGLIILGCTIRTSLITAGIISLLYWLGIILFTEHKSQTWMYTKGPWYLAHIKRNHNRVISKTYKESALDMFSRKTKNKKSKNIQEQNENNLKDK